MKTLAKAKQLIEGNKLIAEFMGFGDAGTNNMLYAIIIYGKVVGYYHPETMLFHKSWNWLMPVVEKIEQTKSASITIHAKNLVHISFNCGTDVFYSGSLIQNIWEAVIKFIKWYNENK